jgi:hypothetical protein
MPALGNSAMRLHSNISARGTHRESDGTSPD